MYGWPHCVGAVAAKEVVTCQCKKHHRVLGQFWKAEVDYFERAPKSSDVSQMNSPVERKN